jgi:hypothetical protein
MNCERAVVASSLAARFISPPRQLTRRSPLSVKLAVEIRVQRHEAAAGRRTPTQPARHAGSARPARRIGCDVGHGVTAASFLKTQSFRFLATSFRCFAARCCAATVGNKFAHAIPNSNASKKRDAQHEKNGLVAHGAVLCMAFRTKKEPRRRGANFACSAYFGIRSGDEWGAVSSPACLVP